MEIMTTLTLKPFNKNISGDLGRFLRCPDGRAKKYKMTQCVFFESGEDDTSPGAYCPFHYHFDDEHHALTYGCGSGHHAHAYDDDDHLVVLVSLLRVFLPMRGQIPLEHDPWLERQTASFIWSDSLIMMVMIMIV